MSEILISKGERLTTPDGGTYATAQIDIHRLAPMNPADWRLADGSAPQRNDPIPDGVLEFDGPGIIRARVNGEWRSFV